MKRLLAFRLALGLALVLVAPLAVPRVLAAAEADGVHPELSSGARLAAKRLHDLRQVSDQSGGCVNEPDCEDEDVVVAGLTQSETTIAVDATGQHVVVGFNDFRGFLINPTVAPTSISGFMYSDDGGQTFVNGGQLPSPGTDVVFGQRFPQIFGDPDVKYVSGCTFVYTSLALEKFGNGLVQSLVVHRSTDCGHSWQGPFSIPASQNPNGLIDVNGDAVDAADKELTDIDPDTGRYMVCWTNFTTVAPADVEISCTYSDNILAATPTFAPRRVIASSAVDGQGSAVRFAGNGSPLAVVAWSRFASFYTNNIGFSRSTDNGVTWSAPVNLTSNFITMDQVLGNDRVNNNPSVAIDTSSGPYANRVYVVYSNNNSLDGANVAMQRSLDGGVTFSAPILLNSRPGADRAQWLPYVTVDRTTGRVNVFYYDQGIDTSGDITEVTYTFSDDGGTTWSKPVPLSDRPFKAGWGNDTGQPNLGDYNQAVAQFATLYVSNAITRSVGFADGQPSTSLTTPDVEAKAVPAGFKAALRLGTLSFTDTGGNGNIDPGEDVILQIPLRNYVTNPLNASSVVGISASLATTAAGVTIVQGSSAYPDAAAGATVTNSTPFRLQLASSFPIGTPIPLTLNVTTTEGPTALALTLRTGTPVYTTLMSENFDGVAPGAMPPGWTRAHGAGPNTVPWTTNNTFCGGSNKAFHTEANDVPNASTFSRWERLFSPTITVPPSSQYVSVDFDVCYDTEDDPVLPVLGYDGFFLRVTDVTPGRTLRSVLAEAFEQEFTTDGFKHYPKHFPRNGDPNYFEDMSVWSGSSGGQQHVHLEFPGMAGSQFQLRFEYAQDQLGLCTDLRPGHTCGVSVDNVVIRNVLSVAPSPALLGFQQTLTRDPVTNEIISTITVTNKGGTAATNVQLTSVLLGSVATTSPLPVFGTIAPGGSATATVRFPAGAAAPGTANVLRIMATRDGGNMATSFRVLVP
jgi:hypothetical protein